jgi:hypothetical protein
MRSVKSIDDSEKLFSAEFVYYWSQNIVLNYHITEKYSDEENASNKERQLKI